MPPRRTDAPVKKTHRLSAEACRLLALLAARVATEQGQATETQVLERAIRELARKLKLS